MHEEHRLAGRAWRGAQRFPRILIPAFEAVGHDGARQPELLVPMAHQQDIIIPADAAHLLAGLDLTAGNGPERADDAIAAFDAEHVAMCRRKSQAVNFVSIHAPVKGRRFDALVVPSLHMFRSTPP